MQKFHAKTSLDYLGHSRGDLSNGKVNFLNLYICKGVFLTFLGPALVQKNIRISLFWPQMAFQNVFHRPKLRYICRLHIMGK